MSSSSETLFGQDKNVVIAVASIIIFVCAVAMLGVFINNGVSSGWSASTILATVFSSVIAFIFVSLAVSYGFVKGKQAVGSAVGELNRLRAGDKERSEKLAAEIAAARKKVAENEMNARKAVEKAKEEATKKAAEDAKYKKEVEDKVKAQIEKDKAAAALIVAANANKVAADAKQAAVTGILKSASTQYGSIPPKK